MFTIQFQRLGSDGVPTADEVEELITKLQSFAPDIAELLKDRLETIEDPISALREAVEDDLYPRKRFYNYSEANDYASDALATVAWAEEMAKQIPSPGLVPVLERAITLATRAILRSDDSSGLQGGLIEDLLNAHATTVAACVPRLSPKEQKCLINWVVKYRYGGKQDFFDPDIVAYAPGLDTAAIEQYRTAISNVELDRYSTYPIRRLAVLDRELDAIVAANGGTPTRAYQAHAIAVDLAEAGLRSDAERIANLGLTLEVTWQSEGLVDFLVGMALEDGSPARAMDISRTWFLSHPSSGSFARLKGAAKTAGVWEDERLAAEVVYQKVAPDRFLGYLLAEDRDDQAWEYAHSIGSEPDASESWIELCERRARTHPEQALAVFPAVIDGVLIPTEKYSYRQGAKLLQQMQAAAQTVGGEAPAQFQKYLDQVVERNRRRPNCMAAFRRKGLID